MLKVNILACIDDEDDDDTSVYWVAVFDAGLALVYSFMVLKCWTY